MISPLDTLNSTFEADFFTRYARYAMVAGKLVPFVRTSSDGVRFTTRNLKLETRNSNTRYAAPGKEKIAIGISNKWRRWLACGLRRRLADSFQGKLR